MIPILWAFSFWQKANFTPLFNEVVGVSPHPLDSNKIIAASAREIYERNSDGRWKTLWFFQSLGEQIEKIVPSRNAHSIFILTSQSVFQYQLDSQKCRKIYNGRRGADHKVFSFALLPGDPEHLFLGTADGLFESDNAGRVWYRFENFHGKTISILRFGNDRLFAAAANKLFLSTDLSYFHQVFSLSSFPSSAEPEDAAASEDTGEEPLQETPAPLRELVFHEDEAWLATDRGVFKSEDGGETWFPLGRSGLRSVSLKYLVYSQARHQLFTATDSAVYVYDPLKNNWREFSRGMTARQTKGLFLAEEKDPKLIAATDQGLMQYPLLPDHVRPAAESFKPEIAKLFHQLISSEPSILQIQRKIIKRNDLDPDKIRRWQGESRLSAFLPTLSFGKDFSRGNSIDLDRGGTNDPDKYITGPDGLRRSWNCNLNWHLSDFIWSSSQTSIDSRSKLMTELRNDMLSEAVRIFYERRRVQMQILFSPASSEEEHLEKLLQLDELTALLDGMTNGFMTRQIQKVYRQDPALEQLWQYQDANHDFSSASGTRKSSI